MPGGPSLGGSIGEAPVAVSGSRLAIGGRFYTVDPGVRRHGLAALDAVTGQPLAWAPNLDLRPYAQVRSLAVVGGTVYASGEFTDAGGQPRAGLAAFDARTASLLPWHPRVGCDIGSCGQIAAVTPDAVYVTGTGMTVDGREPEVAAFDPVSGARLRWDPEVGPYSWVGSVAVAGTTVYLGGAFKYLGGVQRPNLAAVDATTGKPEDWQPQPDGIVRTLVLVGTTLYVAGDFEHIGGKPRHHLAAFDTNSGDLLPWYPRLNDRGAYPTLSTLGPLVVVDGVPVDGVTGEAKRWPTGFPGLAADAVVTGSTVFEVTGNEWGGVVAVPAPR
jgi:hypothetical protein